ncbi:MAG TPA: Ig-like domain-containing protein [Geothrix sp.]|nr:Ig-like domain-containing protein [Geothrix sp.]
MGLTPFSKFANPTHLLLAGLCSLLMTACGGGSSPTPQTPPASATLTTLVLAPASVTLAPGGTRQLTATGTYSDGTSRDLSATVSWTSTAPAIATVSNTGLAAAMSAGTATIAASVSGVSGQAVVSVTSASATLTALSITPSNPSIAKGGTRQLTAMGAYSDGTSHDLSSTVTWSSSAPGTAAVSGTGLVTGVNAGSATLTAASGNVSAQATVTVSPATLQTLAITPSNPSIALGGTKGFTATGTFSDGSTGPVAATWTSSSLAVATIDASGTATGLAAGSTTITAAFGGATATTTLAVSGATLTSIQITPSNPSVAQGSSRTLTATGTYSDGSTANLTTSATWSSAATATALVNGGIVTGVAAGSTTITATLGTLSGSTTLTVTTPITVSLIEVSPASASLPLNAVQTFQAIVTWSDGSKLNMSYDVAWTSQDNAIITIDNLGEATTHAAGTTHILASYGGAVGQAAVTVTAPTLTSISLDPPTATLNVGGSVDLTSTGNFSNGVSTVPYDSNLTWSSNAPAVATVDTFGVVTAVGAGTAVIAASANGVTGTATVTVNGPTFDPMLIGSWQFIDITGTWGSFYTFNADGTFTYSLIYINHDICVSTSKHVAYRSGTFSSAPGKIILNITTTYDDDFNCSGYGTRTTFQPSIQEHQAYFQGGLLYTNNPNDFYPTGWLGHTKQ